MLRLNLESLGAIAAKGHEELVSKIKDTPLTENEFASLNGVVKYICAGETFQDVMKVFPTEQGTPAGFRRDLTLRYRFKNCVNLQRDVE